MMNVAWRVTPHTMNKGKVTIITVGTWGGENTPEVVAWDVDPLVADHIVALHNNSLVTS